jgi:cytochrome P450
LGAHLARLEVAAVLRLLGPRLDRLRLDGPVERLRSDHINGVKRLPVAVG